MAIRKYAKNITINVKNSHQLCVGGKFEKIASKINKEATKGDFTLISNKKIMTNGNKH